MNASWPLAAAVCFAGCLATATSVGRAQSAETDAAAPSEALELSEATEPTLTTKEGLERIVRLMKRKASAPSNDFERLLGWWVVESCTMNGEPVADSVGELQLFSRNGEVEIHGSDFWARQHFVVDVTTEPHRLATSYTEGFIDAPGIYAFDGDQLKVRESLQPERLSFDAKPQGDYWDTTLRKVSPEEAQRLLQNREVRLDKIRESEGAATP